MVSGDKISDVAITFLIGVIMLGIAMIFGLTMGVQLQTYVTQSIGNFSGLNAFIVNNLVLFLLLVVMAFGAGFVYMAYRMATKNN